MSQKKRRRPQTTKYRILNQMRRSESEDPCGFFLIGRGELPTAQGPREGSKKGRLNSREARVVRKNRDHIPLPSSRKTAGERRLLESSFCVERGKENGSDPWVLLLQKREKRGKGKEQNIQTHQTDGIALPPSTKREGLLNCRSRNLNHFRGLREVDLSPI